MSKESQIERLEPLELSPYSDGEKAILEVLYRLHAKNRSLFALEDKYVLVRDILEISDKKIIFSYEGQEYRIGSTDLSRDDEVYVEKENVMKVDDIAILIDDIQKMRALLRKYQDEIPWVKGMSLQTLWKYASKNDLHNTHEFFVRKTEEILMANDMCRRLDVRGVILRGESVDMQIDVSYAPSSQYEAPSQINISCGESPLSGDLDGKRVHHVIFGKNSPETATIYSVQLGRINGVLSTTIEKYLAVDRDREYERLLGIIELEASDYPEIERLKGHNLHDNADRLEAVKQFKKFSKWYSEDFDRPQSMRVFDIIPFVKILEIEEIVAEQNKRKKLLQKFNHGTARGGAKLVSLVTALMVLKKTGIKTVSIPLELPRAEHIGKESVFGPRQQKDVLRYIRGSLIKLTQDFSRAFDVQISEKDDSYQIDLDSWDPSKILVGDSKTLISLVSNFPK